MDYTRATESSNINKHSPPSPPPTKLHLLRRLEFSPLPSDPLHLLLSFYFTIPLPDINHITKWSISNIPIFSMDEIGNNQLQMQA
jgi:hypothetical protein